MAFSFARVFPRELARGFALVVACVVVLAASAGSTSARAAAPAVAPAPSVPRTFTTAYVCDDARVVGITQAVTRRANQPLRVTFGAEARDVQPAPAAAGVRYTDAAEAWAWQGQDATFALVDLAANVTLANRCRAVAAPRSTRPAAPARERAK